jgi:hypothetical protein
MLENGGGVGMHVGRGCWPPAREKLVDWGTVQNS